MKNIRLGRKIVLPGLIITPVEEITIESHPGKNSIGIYGTCEPLGIIIESAERRWGLDTNGNVVNPEVWIW